MTHATMRTHARITHTQHTHTLECTPRNAPTHTYALCVHAYKCMTHANTQDKWRVKVDECSKE